MSFHKKCGVCIITYIGLVNIKYFYDLSIIISDSLGYDNFVFPVTGMPFVIELTIVMFVLYFTLCFLFCDLLKSKLI